MKEPGLLKKGLGMVGVLAAVAAMPALASGYGDRQGYATDGELNGNYTVPAPQELAADASFKICYAVTTDTDGMLILKYHLPPEIVGAGKAGIELKQSGPAVGGFLPFRGLNGNPDSANCRKHSDTEHGETLKCFVAYPGLDTSGSADYVRANYTTDLPQRLQVASMFSADPVGIVYVELNASPPQP